MVVVVAVTAVAREAESSRVVVRMDTRAFVAARADEFVDVRGTTRRPAADVVVPAPDVAARAVVALFVAARAVRDTTRRGSDIGVVRTITSIGLLVMLTVVPGFNSVRI